MHVLNAVFTRLSSIVASMCTVGISRGHPAGGSRARHPSTSSNAVMYTDLSEISDCATVKSSLSTNLHLDREFVARVVNCGMAMHARVVVTHPRKWRSRLRLLSTRIRRTAAARVGFAGSHFAKYGVLTSVSEGHCSNDASPRAVAISARARPSCVCRSDISRSVFLTMRVITGQEIVVSNTATACIR